MSIRSPADEPRRDEPSTNQSLSLTERVYYDLREEILTCAIPPGTEISEGELAERFGVSKTPVREALAKLRADGFVRTFPRRGYLVVPVTIGDINELFDVRTILEVGAVELACHRIRSDELARLQRLAKQTYDRTRQPSLRRFIAANRDFHAAIARASQNQRLEKLLIQQLLELERLFYFGARLRDINDEVQDDHERLVQALGDRDAARARQLMASHNEKTRTGLIAALTRSGPGQEVWIG